MKQHKAKFGHRGTVKPDRGPGEASAWPVSKKSHIDSDAVQGLWQPGQGK